MTNYLHSRITRYEQSANTLKLFEDMVRKPFDYHKKTEAWQSQVLDSYKKKNFERIRDIIGRGQAHFDESKYGLTPDERVLVYCYGNMQQHIVSNIYIFEQHGYLFDEYIFDNKRRVVFIDIGCGPLTSGIAFKIYHSESKKSNGNLNFHYIGVDKAESMLRKAKEFSLYPGLFHSNNTFKFFKNSGNNLSSFMFETLTANALFSYMDNYTGKKTLIILNFSYFFASPSLNASKLANFIKILLARYESSQVCLVFQNPQGPFNEKWDLFQNEVQDLRSKIAGPIAEKFSYYDLTNGKQRVTRLYYDIQFR